MPGRRGAGWNSRTTFVLALSASAVGLGNLWRFSYLAGEHGGAPFVVTYMCVPVPGGGAVNGGRSGRRQPRPGGPVAALRWASDRSLLSRGWMLVGWLACLTGLLILSYYVVVAGWGLAYARYMQAGVFSAASAAVVGEQFAASGRAAAPGLLAEPVPAAGGGFVLFGVRRGLGLLVWLAVPVLITMLAVLVKFSFDNGDMVAAREFLFSVKWIDFSPRAVLVALGHALFTLGVGVGTGISYGAYAPERIPIGRSVMAVAVFDTMIALLAGLAIFPLVFANNMEPAMGPGLLFVSVPYAFGNMVQGELFGTVFFLLVVVAALGSAVAMMEPVVRTLMQQARCGASRRCWWSAVVWLLGLAVVLSLRRRESALVWQ